VLSSLAIQNRPHISSHSVTVCHLSPRLLYLSQAMTGARKNPPRTSAHPRGKRPPPVHLPLSPGSCHSRVASFPVYGPCLRFQSEAGAIPRPWMGHDQARIRACRACRQASGRAAGGAHTVQRACRRCLFYRPSLDYVPLPQFPHRNIVGYHRTDERQSAGWGAVPLRVLVAPPS
jgi:hypothetical protein